MERQTYGSTSLFAIRKDIAIHKNNETWQQVNKHTWRWSTSFTLEEDRPIAFVFEEFALPPHSRLFVYDKQGKSVLGAYTYQNNNDSGNFMSDLISGREILIEYVVESERIPKAVPFNVKAIYQSLYSLETISASMEIDTGFMAARPCHPNANCPEGDLLDNQKRSICRILMVLEEGLVYCSGTLMNNTLEDQRPFILSALHCQDYFTPIHELWRFDFNFLAVNCESPTDSPSFDRIIGCRQLAAHRDSDLLLVELNFTVPSSFDVYYAGWNRETDYVPQPAFHLHHPLGDIMKISVDENDLRIHNDQIRWDNGTRTPSMHHYRCELDVGAHQIGSSGGPLLDDAGRVVGQLHGGTVDSLDCSSNRSFFGRLSRSWTGGGDPDSRLSDWLDPFFSDTTLIDGLNQGESDLVYQVVGQVLFSDGSPIENVEMQLSGSGFGSTFTDKNGNFIFTNIPVLAEFSIIPVLRGSSPAEGVSSTDVLLAQQSIIGLRPYDNAIQELAADVSGDGSVSSADLVQMINVILGLQASYGSEMVWGFDPPRIFFPNDTNVGFTAYKVGDVNFSFEFGN